MSENQTPPIDRHAQVFVRRIEHVRHLSASDLDSLPFGVIKVDRQGVVLAYNQSEAQLARRKPEEVLGRNFFTEVAPCTNVKEFADRFRDGVARGNVRLTFPFVFTFPNRPVHVMVTISYDAPDPHGWILVDQFQSGVAPA